jgi:hypothetical protein
MEMGDAGGRARGLLFVDSFTNNASVGFTWRATAGCRPRRSTSSSTTTSRVAIAHSLQELVAPPRLRRRHRPSAT